MIESAKKDGRVSFDENGHHNTYGFGLLSPEGIVNALYPSNEEPVSEPEPEQPVPEEGGCQLPRTPLSWRCFSHGFGYFVDLEKRPANFEVCTSGAHGIVLVTVLLTFLVVFFDSQLDGVPIFQLDDEWNHGGGNAAPSNSTNCS